VVAVLVSKDTVTIRGGGLLTVVEDASSYAVALIRSDRPMELFARNLGT
jgi:hypothetical protein